ncbi:hypothetical protein [Salinicoccus sp. RF5]|uniref:hypothetical protein n=1 Tax=Salinicoccus sp. RF5 TaxID=2748874 RepID=UPI001E3935F0|nr:hypothetical protein [Salinicoccus sp. RF5]MCC4722952.1 hypothetical protein [Salinicoccus sp. RF5]
MSLELDMIEKRDYLKQSSDNMFLYGWLDINDEEYNELMAKSKELLSSDNIFSYNSESKDVVITLSLVEYARRVYTDDEDLFISFLNELDISSSLLDLKLLQKLVFKHLKQHAHVIETEKSKRYRDSILMQNFILNCNADKIFEFLVEVYFRELKENINHRHVTTFFLKLYHAFRDYILNEEDNDISSEKMTGIIQTVPNYFIHAYYNSPEFVTTILREWLTYIHALNFNIVPVFKKNKYTAIFKNKYTDIKREILIREQGKARETHKNVHAHKYLELNERGLIINIPSYHIYEYENRSYKVNIYNNEKLINSHHLEVIHTEIGYATENKKFLINKLSTDLRYEVYENDKIIYDSKDFFVRDFYLFNDKERLVSINQLKLDNSFTIVTPYEIETIKDGNEEREFRDGCNLYTSLLEEDTEVVVNDYLINAKGINFDTGFLKDDLFSHVKLMIDKQEIQLIKSFSNFYLKLHRDEYISDFILEINNSEKFDLDKLYNAEVIEEAGEAVVVKVDIKKIIRMLRIEFNNTNVYEVGLRKKGATIWTYHGLFMPIGRLDYKFDKQLYTKEKHATLLELQSPLIEEEFHPLTHPTNTEGTFVFPLDQKSKLIFQLPSILSKAGSEDEEIWVEDFKETSIRTQGLANHPIWQVEAGGPITPLKLGVIEKRGGYKEFNLENFNKLSSPSKTLYINVKGEKFSIFKVTNQPKIKSLLTIPDGKDLIVKCNYVGPKNLKIRYERYNEPDKLMTLSLSDEVMFPGVLTDYHKYTLSIIREKKYFSNSVDIVESRSEYYGDFLIIESKQKNLKIDSVICDEDRYEIKNLYVRFTWISQSDIYIAKMYHMAVDHVSGNIKVKYYDYINPVRMEMLYSDEEYITFRGQDTNQEALILDKETGFLNTYYNLRDYSRYLIIDEIILRKDECLV